MIELHITMTGKSFSPKDEFRRMGEEVKRFPDMASAKLWLKEFYGNSKRYPMFHDTKEGTKKTGYVIGYRNADWSHAPVQHWIQQDWCEFRECKTLELK